MINPVRGTLLALSLVALGASGCSAGTTSGSPKTASSSPSQITPSSSSSSKPVLEGAAFTNKTTADALELSASRDLSILQSYDYRNLNKSMQAALAVTTGPFTQTFRTTFMNAVLPNAPQLHASQTAEITHTGVAFLDTYGTHAVVLAFGQLSITNDSGGTTPHKDLFGAIVQMQLVNSAWLISGLTSDDVPSVQGSPPGSAALVAAASAAKNEVLAVLTYSRASFTKDFDRALNGATGQLRSTLNGLRSTTLQSLTAGHFDLRGTLDAAAVESASDGTVTMMVTATGGRTGGTATNSTERFLVTMTNVNGRWLASQIAAVGIN